MCSRFLIAVDGGADEGVALCRGKSPEKFAEIYRRRICDIRQGHRHR
jgi:hypothetical protein